MLSAAMGSAEVQNESCLGWNDDESWEFPVLPIQDNGGKLLIEGGKILTDAAVVPEKVNEAPPQPAKGKKKAGGSKRRSNEGKGGGSVESGDHEQHIWTERERRKRMRTMFSTLHTLIPRLHPRSDKATIIDEAIDYIKTLQQTLEDLQRQKLEKEKEKGKGKGKGKANATACDAPSQSREAFMAEQGSTAAGPNPMVPVGRAAFKTWSSPNVVLNVCGMEAHINIVCGPTKPGFLTTLVLVMEKFNLELVSAHVSSDPTARSFMFHVRANGIPQQFPEAAFLVEETYKQAAAELTIWINS